MRTLTTLFIALIMFAWPVMAWRTVASMNHPRWTLAAGVLQDQVYAVGGQFGTDDSTITATTERYNSSADKWSMSANMSLARVGHAVAALNGSLYAVGGWADSCGANGCQLAESYTPEESAWKTLPPLAFGRDHPGAAAVAGKLFVLGGCDGWDAEGKCVKLISTVETFDPATNKWSTVAPMLTPRWGMGVAVLDGILYAMGGEDANLTRLDVVEAYDPATDKWSKRAPMPEPRAWFGTGSGGYPAGEGTVYVVGGCNQSSCRTPLSSMAGYRPTENKWVTLSNQHSMPGPRFEFAMGVIDAIGTLYVLGGLRNDTERGTDGTLATVLALQMVDDWG